MGVEQRFDILAGSGADLLKHAALLADDDPLYESHARNRASR